MVISVSTTLGRHLVDINPILSHLLPSILTSIFPTATVPDSDVSYVVSHHYAKRDELPETQKIIFGCLIPVLVILSGVFAGLTLGYMSLDETQLNVLSISGTPEQQRYAERIKPIRKNGHLLLVTLLLSNMIVNETLPVIADPVLGGGFQGVVVSTVLIVLFAEVIPQSICTRYGLWVGAKMAPVVQVLLWTMGIVAWPVAKLLELVLGPHHGIIYRRTELKELIAMHSNEGRHGGDLNTDTVTIIGATLDLQEKVVRQAMTPINDVFMLSIDSRLDYDTLRKICATGHSRVPVYEEVEVPTSGIIEARNKAGPAVPSPSGSKEDGKTMVVKKIMGVLLVKQCVLLDPSDAIPLRQMKLNKVLFVPNDEPLLGILDRFQEGRSHMAMVSRFSAARAKSVKKAVKQSLTQRIRQSVGISDDSSSSSEDEESEDETGSTGTCTKPRQSTSDSQTDPDLTLRGKPVLESDKDGRSDGGASEQGTAKLRFRLRRKKDRKRRRGRGDKKEKQGDIEMGKIDKDADNGRGGGFGLSSKEQINPADAVLAEESANEFLQILDPAIMPLGIITLEDVLEELIGEEIYDEFDPHDQGAQLSSFIPPDPDAGATPTTVGINDTGHDNRGGPTHAGVPTLNRSGNSTSVISGLGLGSGPVIIKPMALRAKEGFGLLMGRSKSTPPIPREQLPPNPAAPLQTADHNTSASTVTPVEGTDKRTNIPYLDLPSPHFLNPTSVPSPGNQPPGSQPHTPMHESLTPLTSSTSPHSIIPMPPQNPPSTSLEAYLFDRKRRGVSGGGGIPRIVTPTPGVKGKGFKSSPLSPTERDKLDGVKESKDASSVVKGGDGSVHTSEAVVEDGKLK